MDAGHTLYFTAEVIDLHCYNFNLYKELEVNLRLYAIE